MVCGTVVDAHNDLLRLRNKITISDSSNQELISFDIGKDQTLLGTVSEIVHLETSGMILLSLNRDLVAKSRSKMDSHCV